LRQSWICWGAGLFALDECTTILVKNTIMKAMLIRHEKFIVRRRYLIEISVHQLSRSTKYVDGLKWGLICLDRVSGKRVLMDNHHPKGPHIHIDHRELPYEFVNLDQLVADFRRLIVEHMGVQI